MIDLFCGVPVLRSAVLNPFRCAESIEPKAPTSDAAPAAGDPSQTATHEANSCASNPASVPTVGTVPSTPSKATPPPARAPPVPLLRGFRNLGNTCYASVVYHTMLQCSRFRELLLTVEPTEAAQKTAPLFHALRVLSAPYFAPPLAAEAGAKQRSPAPPPVDPTGLMGTVAGLNATFAAKGRQQDAEEFYAWMLATLHEEISRCACER
jgi:hypothetical protein